MDKATVLWQPTKAEIQTTPLWTWMQQLGFDDYAALYQWSIKEPAAFWQAWAESLPIHWHMQPHTIMQSGAHMLDTRWFCGAKLNYAEFCLQHRSDKTALIAIDEQGMRKTLSYNQLYEQVAMSANGMLALGIQAGDVVGGILPNGIHAITFMLATTAIGAIWSSCSPDFGPEAILDRFGQIQPRLLFAARKQVYNQKTHDLTERIQTISRALPSLKKTIFIDDQFDAFLSDDKTIHFASLDFDHPLAILFSSGTTGKPKCIVHGIGGTLLQHSKEHRLHTDIRANDVFCYLTTCGWMMWNWMASALATACTLVLYDGAPMTPTTDKLFDIIQSEKISIFGASAKYITALEKAHCQPVKTHQLSALKTILSTGSPLSPENYDYVYQAIKPTIRLCSISGGTDILSCFALGNPILPIYRGQLQCWGLGLAVDVFDEQGQALQYTQGELVCTQAFPCMPVSFWDDPVGEKYFNAYFAKYPNIWAHGDYAATTPEGGLIIYGRSDAVLNPGGVRIGTAEIYRQVEKFDAVLESLVVGQTTDDDIRLILFVKLRDTMKLDHTLTTQIKQAIRTQASPRHVPEKIVQVPDIPKTHSGKIVELAVKALVNNQPIKNIPSIVNPEALDALKKALAKTNQHELPPRLKRGD